MTRARAPDTANVSPSETLIRQYYASFNDRRLTDAAALFADDAVLERVPQRQSQRGGAGYLQFADAWLSAFPDVVLTVQRVVARDAATYEVSLAAIGTHRGAFDLGGWVFKPTGAAATLSARELLELRDGKIAFSSLSFDTQQMVEQLARVDCVKLLEHIDRIRSLGEDLAAVQGDTPRLREVIDRVGRELDAARHTVRPYFKR
jgi:predicted ester cyclase